MVSHQRNKINLYQLGGRILILLAVSTIGFFTGDILWLTFKEYFYFQKPSGFFGFTLAELFLAWGLSIVFWSGILYGMLGKQIDYIFIGIIFIIGSWNFLTTEQMSIQMYLGLVGVAIVGNIIGYLLKLARLKWFAK